MARALAESFADVIALARARLTQVDHELIPHRHGPDKATTELTEEWTAQQFLNELESLVGNSSAM